MGIKHAHQTSLPENPAKDVSKDRWNGDHAIDGDVDADGHKITNLGAPSDPSDAARLQDVSGGALLGPPTTLTLVNGVLDVNGLHYILLDGEGNADDLVERIDGGVDGQFLVIEKGPNENVITFSPAGGSENVTMVNLELDSTELGNFVDQVLLIYSAVQAMWMLWSLQPVDHIMSSDGDTEVFVDNGNIHGSVTGTSRFSISTQFEIYGLPLFIDGSYVHVRGATLPADNLIGAGDFVLAFDPTDGASKLLIKGKSADGTVVTGEVPLI